MTVDQISALSSPRSAVGQHAILCHIIKLNHYIKWVSANTGKYVSLLQMCVVSLLKCTCICTVWCCVAVYVWGKERMPSLPPVETRTWKEWHKLTTASVLCKASYHLCSVFVYEMPLISAQHCSLVLSTGQLWQYFLGSRGKPRTCAHSHYLMEMP